MAFIPVNNTVSAELIYLWNSQVCETVLHYTISAPWEPEAMAELAEKLKNAFNTHMVSRCSDQLQLTQIRITDLSDQNGPVVNYSTGLPIVGSQTSPSLPNNCALVITKRTYNRGRSFRGRIFHPGLVEGFVTGNEVISGTAAAIRDAWEEFLAFDLPVAVETASLVVVSFYSEGAPRAAGVATIVTGMTTDGVVDSQRRRLPGRGQ